MSFTKLKHGFADNIEDIDVPESAFLITFTIDPMDISRYIYFYYV